MSRDLEPADLDRLANVTIHSVEVNDSGGGHAGTDITFHLEGQPDFTLRSWDYEGYSSGFYAYWGEVPE